MAYYLFPHQHLKPIYDEQRLRELQLWADVSKSTSWWWPYSNGIVAAERPSRIRRDGDLLHSDDSPAVEFRDGWQHWAIDGITVDEQIVMSPGSQTVEQINGDENEERRRIRIERFGVLRYVESSGSKVVETRKNEVENTYEILVETLHGQRLMTHCPSTGRRYFLSVPDRVETCEQAQRAIWGVDFNIIGRT